MLLNNLKCIFKSRLTIFVIIFLFAVAFGYTFYDIYQEFRMFSYGSFKECIINYEYVWDRPYAASSWTSFMKNYSAFLFLVIPLSMCFTFYNSSNYENMLNQRGSKLKRTIFQSLSVAIATAIIFFFIYLFSMLAFYFTMGFDIEPWKIAYHNGEVELLGNYLAEFDSRDFLFRDLFWMNNGNSTVIFFIVVDLIGSLIMFSFIFMTSMLAYLFSRNVRFYAFLILNYFFLLALGFISNDYIHYELVEMIKVFGITKKCCLQSFLSFPFFSIGIVILAYVVCYCLRIFKKRKAIF